MNQRKAKENQTGFGLLGSNISMETAFSLKSVNRGFNI